MELALNPEKVCFIIIKAREWSAQYVAGSPTDASNPTDDGSQRTLSSQYGGSPDAEIQSFLEHFNEAELLNLHALMLVGRGTHETENWRDALEDARTAQADGTTIRRLLDTPLLADYLEEGLRAFGKSCDDYGPRSD